MSDPHREPNGRFHKRGKGGPGRPRRAIESDYLAKLSEAVPLSVWQEIVAKAVEEAREGDHAARAWLAGYLCGKPTGDALRNLAVDEEVGVDALAALISGAELKNAILGVMKKSQRRERAIIRRFAPYLIFHPGRRFSYTIGESRE